MGRGSAATAAATLLALGTEIRRARTVAGLTQQELADKLGVRHWAVGRYELGLVDLPASKLLRIARLLRLDLQRVLRRRTR